MSLKAEPEPADEQQTCDDIGMSLEALATLDVDELKDVLKQEVKDTAKCMRLLNKVLLYKLVEAQKKAAPQTPKRKAADDVRPPEENKKLLLSSAPPSNYTNRSVERWRASDVVEWVSAKNLPFDLSKLIEHELEGLDLFFLDDENLKDELGVENSVHRERILQTIEGLKEKPAKLGI